VSVTHNAALTVVLPSRVELVLIGAEAVVENGGVVNKLGSYQVSGEEGDQKRKGLRVQGCDCRTRAA